MRGNVAPPRGTPKLAPFRLNQRDGNVTAAIGVADLWSDVWTYEVPQGTGIVLQAGDTLSAFLATAPATEVVDPELNHVRVEVRDPSGLSIDQVFGPALYLRVQEFVNRNTIARLGVSAPVKVYPRQRIVICVLSPQIVAVAADASYFDLHTSKVGTPLCR